MHRRWVFVLTLTLTLLCIEGGCLSICDGIPSYPILSMHSVDYLIFSTDAIINLPSNHNRLTNIFSHVFSTHWLIHPLNILSHSFVKVEPIDENSCKLTMVTWGEMCDSYSAWWVRKWVNAILLNQITLSLYKQPYNIHWHPISCFCRWVNLFNAHVFITPKFNHHYPRSPVTTLSSLTV